MCLAHFEKFPVKLNKKGVGIGWKVFRRNKDGSLSPEIYGHRLKKYRINRWITAACPVFFEYPYISKRRRRKRGYTPYLYKCVVAKEILITNMRG